MRKKKKNEFLQPDIIIDNEEELDNLIKAENEYDESGRLKLIALLFIIPLIFILGFLYRSKFEPELNFDKLEEYKAEHEERSNQRRILESKKMISGAESAISKNDFNRAVFLYRQAMSYQPKNISIQEKLVSTLEESCKNENEIHCHAIEKAKKKLEALKENK